MHIDWEQLSKALDCESSGGTKHARRALSQILGDDAIQQAVECYIAERPGSELARSVLWLIHPRFGMEYCYQVFKKDTDIDRRRNAVELLCVVADESAFKWVPEFLEDPDELIQAWGAGVVDQLLWSKFIDAEDCQEVLTRMKNHANIHVRERFEFITEFLSHRRASS